MDEKREELKKERVPLFIVYIENNKISAEQSRDANIFQLYGFLKAYGAELEQRILKKFKNFDNKYI